MVQKMNPGPNPTNTSKLSVAEDPNGTLLCHVCGRRWRAILVRDDEALLRACRDWMQAALEELTICATAHPGSQLADAERLLEEVDLALSAAMRTVGRGAEAQRRLLEAEGALGAFGEQFPRSIEHLIALARVMEEKR